MTVKQFLIDLKRDTLDSLKKPVNTARRLRETADLVYGLKVFVTILPVYLLVEIISDTIGTFLVVVYSITQGPYNFLSNFIGSIIGTLIGLVLWAVIVVPLTFIIGIIVSFFWMGIIWGVGKLLGGKASYGTLYGGLMPATMGVFLMIMVPMTLIDVFYELIVEITEMSLPDLLTTGGLLLGVFGVLLSVSEIYYQTLFVREIHRISTVKALISTMVPIMLSLALIALITVALTSIIDPTIDTSYVGKSDGYLYKTAIEKGDHSICDKIQDQYLLYACYREVGTKKADLSICDEIQDQDSRDYCYMWVAVAKTDPTICDKIQDQRINDKCYDEVVGSIEDPLVCDKIQDQIQRDRCYKLVAELKGDLLICDKIPSQNRKYNCYNKVAEAKKDPMICGQIPDQDIRDYCYKIVAIAKEDPSVCNKITKYQSDKDYCYRDVAYATKNPSVCDKINGQLTKDRCYAKLSE